MHKNISTGGKKINTCHSSEAEQYILIILLRGWTALKETKPTIKCFQPGVISSPFTLFTGSRILHGNNNIKWVETRNQCMLRKSRLSIDQ